MGLRIFALGDPGPGDGDGAFTASQTDDQELVSEAIFRLVNDQPDLLNMLGGPHTIAWQSVHTRDVPKWLPSPEGFRTAM